MIVTLSYLWDICISCYNWNRFTPLSQGENKPKWQVCQIGIIEIGSIFAVDLLRVNVGYLKLLIIFIFMINSDKETLSSLLTCFVLNL
jgi:hypothetical protein